MAGKKGPKEGRVTVKAKKLIDLIYAKGTPKNLAWKEAGYTSAFTNERVDEVLNRPLCKEYIKKLQNDDISKLQASKSLLIEELMKRLSGAKDSDAVNIVKTLNVMLGYDEPEITESTLEIIWKDLND